MGSIYNQEALYKHFLISTHTRSGEVTLTYTLNTHFAMKTGKYVGNSVGNCLIYIKKIVDNII